MDRQKPIYYVLIFFAAIGYGLIAYAIQRHETTYLISVYAILFLIYLWIIKQEQPNISFWITSAFLFRIIFLFSLPELSDDFYRFIWDGRLWSAGYHPFAELPSTYLEQNISGLDQTLFSQLNSPNYFTIYPPVAQFIFWVSVKIFPNSILGSVIVMRLILLLAEAGTLILIFRLLKRFSLPIKNILIYALNPLVIIELVGNLHFEGLTLFFLLLAVHLLTINNKWVRSALSIALAVGTKLLPLIFIPSIVRALGIKQSIRYGAVLALFALLIFFPLYDQSVFQAMMSSVGLYFNKFEFNASLYYLVREYGFWQYGYNTIQTTGWKLGLIAAILILIFSFRKGLNWNSDNDINSLKILVIDWMWVLFIYFLFVTILHPWYITTLLALSIFTSYRFPIVWTGFIFLTYAGYTHTSFSENLWLTAIEYVVVIGYLSFEVLSRRKKSLPNEA
jgi:alpha-1,6-mannosyltransferase